jgi:hypothetical protein
LVRRVKAKVTVLVIGSNTGQLAALDITTFVINLRLQFVLSHNPSDTIDATGFTGLHITATSSRPAMTVAGSDIEQHIQEEGQKTGKRKPT